MYVILLASAWLCLLWSGMGRLLSSNRITTSSRSAVSGRLRFWASTGLKREPLSTRFTTDRHAATFAPVRLWPKFIGGPALGGPSPWISPHSPEIRALKGGGG